MHYTPNDSPIRRNWGDTVAPILAERLSGETARSVSNGFNTNELPVYLTIGSILEWATPNTIVWGTGFISSTMRLPCKPRKICAVRGPLTRAIVLSQGYDCPEQYGDPALLYPTCYEPRLEKKYVLGMVPHYIEKGEPVLGKWRSNPDVLMIDIQGDVNKVVDDICSCQVIASSSLHGIVLADAYGIPSVWMHITGKVAGDGFKFRDYFAAVNREDVQPLILSDETGLTHILRKSERWSFHFEIATLRRACPFLKGD